MMNYWKPYENIRGEKKSWSWSVNCFPNLTNKNEKLERTKWESVEMLCYHLGES